MASIELLSRYWISDLCSSHQKTYRGRFDFDPVLFSRNVSDSAEGDLVDEEEASLLTPQDNQHFQRRFRGQDGGRRGYLLSDRTLLFLDPLLGTALDIVSATQLGTSEAKRERSEERRVGRERVRTRSSRWSRYHYTDNKKK